MKKIKECLLYFFCRLYAFIPRKVLFLLSYPLSFFLQKIIKYRRSLVKDNLERTYTTKTPKELQEIEDSYYLQLADLILWSFKIPFLSERKIKKHFSFENLHLLDELKKEGHKILILTMGHFANWEVFTAAPYILKEKGFDNINVYKQLHNQAFDRLVKSIRERHKSKSLEMNEVGIKMFRMKRANKLERTSIVSFLADQCPLFNSANYATMFLGQPTSFLNGWAVLAQRLDIPVIYLNIKADHRFHWIGELKLLTKSSKKFDPNDLVEMYVENLEDSIRKTPHLWLWSHNRWRILPQDVTHISYSKKLKEFYDKKI